MGVSLVPGGANDEANLAVASAGLVAIVACVERVGFGPKRGLLFVLP
jgi:hypothetical protein